MQPDTERERERAGQKSDAAAGPSSLFLSGYFHTIFSYGLLDLGLAAVHSTTVVILASRQERERERNLSWALKLRD
jgi:hypothetical protein